LRWTSAPKIVPFSADAPEFVMRALAPAKVREVRLHEDTGIAEVIVPDFQLSLAIGKEGQNARLAARLSGWRVDIKSETQLAEEESGGGVEYAEGEWVTNDSGELVWQPAEGGDAISAAEAGYAAPETPLPTPTAEADGAEPAAAAPPADAPDVEAAAPQPAVPEPALAQGAVPEPAVPEPAVEPEASDA
jgi:N utilization substance protein A